MCPEIRIATSKAFYPPPSNLRKINADSFFANGGDVFGKYVYTLEGGLLGMAYEAMMENDGSYCVVFGEMYDAEKTIHLFALIV